MRERERDEESMRERDRWGSEWVRERGRLWGKVPEKQMCPNCMPTMNVNTL